MSGELKLTGETAEIAKDALRTVCGILDKYKIPYVLEGGTLLGVVRENRLLPWDNDVDITITEDQLERVLALKWRFAISGYRIKPLPIKEERKHFPIGSVRMVKVKRKKLFREKLGIMDVFVKRKRGDQYFWVVGQTDPVLKSVAAHFYEQLGRFRFDGYEYSVPKDYEAYLTCRYGDWRKTVKDYDFKKDDKAIVKP